MGNTTINLKKKVSTWIAGKAGIQIEGIDALKN